MSVRKIVTLTIRSRPEPAAPSTRSRLRNACSACASKSPTPTSAPDSSIAAWPETKTRSPSRIACEILYGAYGSGSVAICSSSATCGFSQPGGRVEGERATPRARRRVEAAADEDEPRAPVVVRPGVEVHRRVDDVLDAVHEQRPVAADVEQPLDPEDVLAARLQQHRQPDAERVPVERLVEDERSTALTSPCSCVVGRVADETRAGRVAWRVEERAPARRRRSDASRTVAVGFSAREPPLERRPASARSVFVTTSVSAAAACLHRLRLAAARDCASTVATTRSSS